MSKTLVDLEQETSAPETAAALDAPAARPDRPEDLERALGMGSRPRRRTVVKWALAGAAVVSGILVGFRLLATGAPAPSYRSVPIERDDLEVVVTATGNLKPTDQVDVGSELSGIVDEVFVDFNDPVRVGDPLARLDASKLEAQAQQMRASVQVSRARVEEASATLEEARLVLERTTELHRSELVPRNSLDAAETAFRRAEASLASARAQVSQAEASLNTIETDLTKAVIRSPVNGVVLTRNVEPGQTVAASFQAPVLFTIAQDLRRMELIVDVDEADVSRVQAGQEARFTVDAYSERSFPAAIRDVRYVSKTVEGVVTYEAILDVENADLLLRPGMTAAADVIVERVEDALLVPNAALRFSHQETMAAGDDRGLVGMLLPRPPRRWRRNGSGPAKPEPRVWTMEDGVPVRIPLELGSSDGTRTVVLGGEVSEGLPVLVEGAPGGGIR